MVLPGQRHLVRFQEIGFELPVPLNLGSERGEFVLHVRLTCRFKGSMTVEDQWRLY